MTHAYDEDAPKPSVDEPLLSRRFSSSKARSGFSGRAFSLAARRPAIRGFCASTMAKPKGWGGRGMANEARRRLTRRQHYPNLRVRLGSA